MKRHKLTKFVPIVILTVISMIVSGCSASDSISSENEDTTSQTTTTVTTTIAETTTDTEVTTSEPAESIVNPTAGSSILPDNLDANKLAAAMKALDLVKEKYEPSYKKQQLDGGLYVYGDPSSWYILELDSYNIDENNKPYFLFHDYEMVEDDPITGDGHTATKNWYSVYEGESTVIPMF